MVCDPNSDRPLIEMEVNGVTRHFTPQEISAHVLRKMRELVEARWFEGSGHRIRKAVIAVPAHFKEVGLTQRV